MTYDYMCETAMDGKKYIANVERFISNPTLSNYALVRKSGNKTFPCLLFENVLGEHRNPLSSCRGCPLDMPFMGTYLCLGYTDINQELFDRRQGEILLHMIQFLEHLKAALE